jgi:hypothetical protein
MLVNLADTVGQLKERIGTALGLSTEEFRLYRKTGSGASEYKRELLKLEQTCKEADMCWGGARMRLVVEKGAPPRQGVHEVKIVWIQSHNNGMWATTKDGGMLEVQEKLRVAEVKKLVVKHCLPGPAGVEEGSTAGNGSASIGIGAGDGGAQRDANDAAGSKMVAEDEGCGVAGRVVHLRICDDKASRAMCRVAT